MTHRLRHDKQICFLRVVSLIHICDTNKFYMQHVWFLRDTTHFTRCGKENHSTLESLSNISQCVAVYVSVLQFVIWFSSTCNMTGSCVTWHIAPDVTRMIFLSQYFCRVCYRVLQCVASIRGTPRQADLPPRAAWLIPMCNFCVWHAHSFLPHVTTAMPYFYFLHYMTCSYERNSAFSIAVVTCGRKEWADVKIKNNVKIKNITFTWPVPMSEIARSSQLWGDNDS